MQKENNMMLHPSFTSSKNLGFHCEILQKIKELRTGWKQVGVLNLNVKQARA